MQTNAAILFGIRKNINFCWQISCQFPRWSGKTPRRDATGIRFALLDADNPREVEQVVAMVAGQGWMADESSVREFQRHFPIGSFIAADGDEVVGCIQSVAMNKDHGGAAHFVVKEKYKGTGVASKLGNMCVKSLGDRNISQYATAAGSEIYKKKWNFKECDPPYFIYAPKFVPQLKSLEDEDPAPHVAINAVTKEDFESLLEYDTSIHIVERKNLLHHFVQKGRCLLAKDKDGAICGYTIINRTNSSLIVAPLFAEKKEIAKKLLKNTFENVSIDDKMKVDLQVFVPEYNSQAMDLFSEVGFTTEKCGKVEYLFSKYQVKVPVEKIYSYTTLSIALA